MTHSSQLIVLSAGGDDTELAKDGLGMEPWTLIALREKLKDEAIEVNCIVYPGYGLNTVEIAELQPALQTIGSDVALKNYEEVWP